MFVLIVCAIGALIATLVRREANLRRVEVLGLCWGLGTGVAGLMTFSLSFFGARLTTGNVLLSLTGLLALLVVLNAASGGGLNRLWVCLSRKRSGRPMDGCERLLTAVVLFFVVSVFVDALSQPLLTFDSRSNLGIKAKILFYQQSVFAEDFFDADRVVGHPRYPLMVPLSENTLYHFIGRVQDRYGKIVFPLWFASLACLFFDGLRRCFSRRFALLGTALLASLPVFTYNVNGGAAGGHADVPLACFFFGFALSLFGGLHNESNADLWLALLFGAFTIFTKNEGLALCGIAVTVAAIGVGWRRSGRLLLPVVGGVILVIPWFEFCTRLPHTDENYWSALRLAQVGEGLSRLPSVLLAFPVHIFLKPFFWSVLGWSVVVLAAIAAPRRLKSPHDLFLTIPVLYCLLLVLIYLVTPWDPARVIPLSLTRLLTQVCPLALFWVMLEIEALELMPKEWTRQESSASGRLRS